MSAGKILWEPQYKGSREIFLLLRMRFFFWIKPRHKNFVKVMYRKYPSTFSQSHIYLQKRCVYEMILTFFRWAVYYVSKNDTLCSYKNWQEITLYFSYLRHNNKSDFLFLFLVTRFCSKGILALYYNVSGISFVTVPCYFRMSILCKYLSAEDFLNKCFFRSLLRLTLSIRQKRKYRKCCCYQGSEAVYWRICLD